MEAFHSRLRRASERRNNDWFGELGESNGGISPRLTTDDYCINKMIDLSSNAFPMTFGTVAVFKRALMSLWVNKFFPPKAQSALLEMWSTLRSTFEKVFKENTWMDDTAKKNAIGKLFNTITYNVALFDETSLEAYHDTFLVESMDPNAFVENQVDFDSEPGA